MQLHFGTFRNVNTAAFNKIGKDSGFDVFRASVDTDALARLLDKMYTKLGGLPKIILYPLNDECLRVVCAISGAFPNVIVGAAWWFNDTVSGIKDNLKPCQNMRFSARISACLPTADRSVRTCGLILPKDTFIVYRR